MDSLTKLAIKYGTDKVGKHNYCPVYHNLFKDNRNEVKKVLEIGVGEGAGLRMFRDFFPNAMIYGGEIDENRIFEENRIKVFKCDQSSERSLNNLIGQTGKDIDLFVDDGSHNPIDQKFTCEAIMPMLKNDAIYVIEDVAQPNILKLIEMSGFKCEMVKLSNRYDDRLIIVRHK